MLPRDPDGTLTAQSYADAGEVIGRKLDAMLGEVREECGLTDLEMLGLLLNRALSMRHLAEEAAVSDTGHGRHSPA